MRQEAHVHPALRATIDRRIDAEEFERRVSAPLTPEELEANTELIRWFRRRYPTVKERLEYARHMYVQMTRPLIAVPRP
jgi:hypothetical protein